MNCHASSIAGSVVAPERLRTFLARRRGASHRREAPALRGAFEKGDDATPRSPPGADGRFRRLHHLGRWVRPDDAGDRAADSGFRSCASVQTSLVMWPIHALGSPEQARWLAALAQRGGAGMLRADGAAVRQRTRPRLQTGHSGRNLVETDRAQALGTNGNKAEVGGLGQAGGDDARSIGSSGERGQFQAGDPGEDVLRASDSAELISMGGRRAAPGATGWGALKCPTKRATGSPGVRGAGRRASRPRATT